MKKMGLKEAMFLLPAILLIVIFSLYPILRVFNYSLFDYRLNDQQKSKLNLSEQYNVELFNENSDYIILFLNEDKAAMGSSAKAMADTIIADTNKLKKLLEGKKGYIKLNGSLKEQIHAFVKDIKSNTDQLTQSASFNNSNNLKLIVKDLDKCVVGTNFTGLNAFKASLSDERMRAAFVHTFLFTVVSVFLEFILGLGLAVIMNKAIKGRGLIRVAALIPWAIPTAVAALMWSYLYDGSNGIVAYIFQNLHLINDSRELLLTAGGAMASSILADVWKTTPYMALLILAGFQTIPNGLYESAEIDGSGIINTFFKITLPLLKPAILVALLFRTLDAFRVFDLIYVLTGGGPGGSTETLSVYAYKLMFEQTNFGYGSVLVILMFVSVAVIATVFVKFLGTNLMERD